MNGSNGKKTTFVSKVYVRVDGTEIERAVMQKLDELVVDQHVHLPDTFTLRFNDPALKLLDEGPFDLTRKVEIKAATLDGKKVTLMKGEITALEPLFAEGMIAQLVVRGYDPSHRLYRQTRSRAFLNKKDSDLAQQIAQEANLSTEIDSTRTVYDHIYQHNQSDLAFLMQRAWRIGYECFLQDGKLFFRQPPANGSGPSLTWGKDLLSFRPRMTLAEQVDEVVVRGWDVEKLEAIVGVASRGQGYPDIGEQKDGAAWAKKLGKGKLVIVDQPVISQAEANTLAQARLDELSGAFVQAEGMAFRRPDLHAGRVVKLEGLGKRFSGSYLITAATHIYTPTGLRTQFSVRGARSGLLSDALSLAAHQERWPGVVTAIVTNTDDPKNWGRVKLKFPWMTDDAESDWARVVGPGAGPEAGFLSLPDVGDEVLVVFAHGDFSQPFVLGGLWNGKHDIPPEVSGAATGEKPLVRTWRSRTGHHLTVHDTADKKIEITSAGGRSVVIDDKEKKITLKTTSVTVILEDNKLSVEAASDVKVKAGTNLNLEAGGNMELKASGQVTVRGATIQLN